MKLDLGTFEELTVHDQVAAVGEVQHPEMTRGSAFVGGVVHLGVDADRDQGPSQDPEPSDSQDECSGDDSGPLPGRLARHARHATPIPVR